MTQPASSHDDPGPVASIEQPGKLMRLAAMARAMLDEARDTPCDEAGCERFRAIYETTMEQLGDVLSTDLHSELGHLAMKLTEPSPSPWELRIAQAKLVGWLEGLFHGIAAAAQDQAATAASQAEAIAEADLRAAPGQYL